MAYYAVAPLLCALMQNEFYMHLYISQVSSGSNDNQAIVVNPGKPRSFGVMAVNDWHITDRPGSGAATIGHAQGLHVQSSQTASSWYSSMNLMFEGTRFNGSTLQVMGLFQIPNDGEWSIMGGTGELVMGRGVVEHKVFHEDSSSRTYELNMHGFYTPMNSSAVSTILGA